jgi:hypothetical protein
MILENWISKYREVRDAVRVDACVSEFKSLIGGKRLVLYGAGTLGTMTYELLRQFDVKVEFVVDKGLLKNNCIIHGFSVVGWFHELHRREFSGSEGAS